MLPLRRDIHFKLDPERVLDWHGDGAAVSAFLNALSVTFPEGERFFIHSVREFRGRIQDPDLKQAVTAFIGQEAMHGREHEAWNQALFDRVPAARAIERKAARRIARWKRVLPASTRLAMTIGAEHVTAVLGDLILRKPQLLGGRRSASEPEYVAALRWHALEETEHKAVAFDVWREVMQGKWRAYPERCLGLVLMLVSYWPDISALIRAELRDRDLDFDREMPALREFLYGREGLLRQLAAPLLGYFKPGFHPWDDDNRQLLAELDEPQFSARAA